MAAKNEITIPVSTAVEIRLAELIWDNCPELARQTVAGKIAMALDIDGPAVQKVMMKLVDKEMNVRVLEHVEKESLKLAEKVAKKAEECVSKLELHGDIAADVKKIIRTEMFLDEIKKHVRNAVNVEVHNIVDTWLNGENKQAMARLVESRIDAFIDSVATTRNPNGQMKEQV